MVGGRRDPLLPERGGQLVTVLLGEAVDDAGVARVLAADERRHVGGHCARLGQHFVAEVSAVEAGDEPGECGVRSDRCSYLTEIWLLWYASILQHVIQRTVEV